MLMIMNPLNIENEHDILSFHRQSMRHVIQDYVIVLNDYESDIEGAIQK